MASGLSDGFVYANKPNAAPAAAVKVTVPQMTKAEYTRGGQRVIFNIPSGKRGQYLNTRMSFLEFRVTVDQSAIDTTMPTSLAASGQSFLPKCPILALDGGAHSFIQNLRVIQGGAPAEEIQGYNTLYQLLLDQGLNPAELGRTVSEGRSDGLEYSAASNGRNWIKHETSAVSLNSASDTSPKTVFVHNPNASDATAHALRRQYMTQRSGQVISPVGLAAGALIHDARFTPEVITAEVPNYAEQKYLLDAKTSQNQRLVTILQKGATRTYTFCIPLVSGVVGAQMSKYLPVGALASDVRLELDLAAWEHAMVVVGAIGMYRSRARPSTGGDILFDENDPVAATYAYDTTISALATGPFNRTWGDKTYNDELVVSTKKGDILDLVSGKWDDKVSVTLHDFNLKLEYIEVAADVQSAIEAATGGEYVMSFDSWNNFTNTIKAGTNATMQPIGVKFSSIKTLNTMFRPAEYINNIGWRGITSRVDPFSVSSPRIGLNSANTAIQPEPYLPGVGWQYLIGATQYPPRPVDSSQEAYMEALKSIHSVTSVSQPGLINKYNWSISARYEGINGRAVGYVGADAFVEAFPAYAAEMGTYYIPQNLESQSHKSHLAESGANTLALQTYLSMRFPTADRFTSLTYGNGTKGTTVDYDSTNTNLEPTLFNPDLQIDTWAHYDGVIVIKNGEIISRF